MFEVGQWWRMPLIPELGRESQTDLCEFEVSERGLQSESRDSHSYVVKPCLEKAKPNNQTNKKPKMCVHVCVCARAHVYLSV